MLDPNFNHSNYFQFAIFTHYAIRITTGLGVFDLKSIWVSQQGIDAYLNQLEKIRVEEGISKVGSWLDNQI